MLIFNFYFSKSAQLTVVMTIEQHSDEAKTGCANSVRAPTWDIQRRRDRLFTELDRKRMVGKPSLFCEDPGRQIHDPFLLPISRGQFCEPRFVKNSSREETEYRENRSSQVKCNLGKMCCARPKLILSAF